MIAGFGDFRSDLIGFVGGLPTMTNAKATSIVNGLSSYIQDQAKAGALQAVPQLKQQAIKILAPPFIAVAAVSVLALGLAIKANRKR